MVKAEEEVVAAVVEAVEDLEGMEAVVEGCHTAEEEVVATVMEVEEVSIT